MLSSSLAIDQLIEKMSTELSTEAVLYIHSTGQIIACSGKLPQDEYPIVAALLAGMVSAGTTLIHSSATNKDPSDDRKRFSCEYRDGGIYSVAVSADYWIAAVYAGVMNPGQLRMKLRTYAEILEKLHTPQVLVTNRSNLAPVSEGLGGNFENITDEEIERLFQY